jgi:hypothetical protein
MAVADSGSAELAGLDAEEVLGAASSGLWRVSQDDPDSGLYAASRDADTVIEYMTKHSKASGASSN